MNSQSPLELFRSRLGDWVESLLERGRYPFRRLDRAPALLTARGELRPDLVLWVNRDSFMAGALLLIPEPAAANTTERGEACAAALGLRHFLVWGADELVFWEIHNGAMSPCKTFPAPPSGSEATDFQQVLVKVLEELKYLAVAGSEDPERLSRYCVANLCRFTLDDIQPVLFETLRLTTAGTATDVPLDLVRQRARNKGLLTIVRLLALLRYDLLASTIQPEAMERAILYALEGLPSPLRAALAAEPEEVHLPLEAAVRCHLFLRRALQLHFFHAAHGLDEVLRLLLASESPLQGIRSFTGHNDGRHERRLILNLRADAHLERDWEVAPASILAGSALSRQLAGHPQPAGQASDLFALSPLPCPDRVVALLCDDRPVQGTERRALEAGLRRSWPNRRLNLPAGSPRWAWEMLHLAGMTADQGHLELTTPADWLQAAFAPPLLRLLIAEFDLPRMELTPSGQLILTLRRTGDPGAATLLQSSTVARTVERPWLESTHPSTLGLAMYLPEDLWQQLSDGRLRIPDDPTWPEGLGREILLFTRSTPGRVLWRTVSGRSELPTGRRLRKLVAQRGMPLPGREVLLQLSSLNGKLSGKMPDRSRIDAEIAPWFGSAIGPEPVPQKPRRTPASNRKGPSPATARELAEVVFVDGLPRFPEHYLLAHYRPALITYNFSPPLVRTREFFGRVSFLDAHGAPVEADDRATADALELAAATGRTTVGLPADPVLTADLVALYRQDLARLHRRLLLEAHRRIDNPRQAEALAAATWDRQGLPEITLFASTETRFPDSKKLLD